jgi:hypothetical protein
MTARHGTTGKNRRRMAVLGGAVGAFAAAAAMATGSTVTAAPAHADFEDLLDPIIQPLITSLSDAIAGFDPTAAADLTSWGDSFLSSLNSLDLAAPAAADPAASTAISGNDVVPLTIKEGTEPLVDVSVDGSTPEAALVDTGSSGLVVPSSDLSLTQWLDLGFPTGISESGYSGGIDYLYLTYNDATVDYGPDGALTTTNTPIDVEFLSWPTTISANSPLDFQQFLTDNDSPGGILGIGDAADAGPDTSPFEAAGESGVTVDEPAGELIVGSNPGTQIASFTGGPIPDTNLTETVTNSSGTVLGTGSVSDDIDSGGVYGTIPSTPYPSDLALGDKVSVYDNGTLLYSYTIQTVDSEGDTNAPTAVSGTSIDSGAYPFIEEPIYISYGGTDGGITFDKP